jgi:hypothetical protein
VVMAPDHFVAGHRIPQKVPTPQAASTKNIHNGRRWASSPTNIRLPLMSCNR